MGLDRSYTKHLDALSQEEVRDGIYITGRNGNVSVSMVGVKAAPISTWRRHGLVMGAGGFVVGVIVGFLLG